MKKISWISENSNGKFKLSWKLLQKISNLEIWNRLCNTIYFIYFRRKADRIKERIQINKDLLNSNEAWISQQQLQRVYQQVLILDLEYALDKKVEQDLWNHGFKNFIGSLQTLAKDKKV